MKDPLAEKLIRETKQAIERSRTNLAQYRKEELHFRHELAKARKRLNDALEALRKNRDSD
jgi:hypothetical protein